MAKSTKSPSKAVIKKVAKSSSKTLGKKTAVSKAITVKSLLPKFIASEGSSSQPATTKITFVNGVGQVTVCLFRNGLQINMETTTGKNVIFSDVQKGDIISVTGVGTGTADVLINIPSTPSTPDHFDGNVIMGSYLIEQ